MNANEIPTDFSALSDGDLELLCTQFVNSLLPQCGGDIIKANRAARADPKGKALFAAWESRISAAKEKERKELSLENLVASSPVRIPDRASILGLGMNPDRTSYGEWEAAAKAANGSSGPNADPENVFDAVASYRRKNIGLTAEQSESAIRADHPVLTVKRDSAIVSRKLQADLPEVTATREKSALMPDNPARAAAAAPRGTDINRADRGGLMIFDDLMNRLGPSAVANAVQVLANNGHREGITASQWSDGLALANILEASGRSSPVSRAYRKYAGKVIAAYARAV